MHEKLLLDALRLWSPARDFDANIDICTPLESALQQLDGYDEYVAAMVERRDDEDEDEIYDGNTSGNTLTIDEFTYSGDIAADNTAVSRRGDDVISSSSYSRGMRELIQTCVLLLRFREAYRSSVIAELEVDQDQGSGRGLSEGAQTLDQPIREYNRFKGRYEPDLIWRSLEGSISVSPYNYHCM